MCRKQETEEEKVLPFYASSLTKEEQEDVDAAVLEQPSEPIANVCCFTQFSILACEPWGGAIFGPSCRVATGQGRLREICFFFKVREKSGISVKWSGK